MSRTKTVAYLRVSTEKQADKGVSLDAQRAKVEAYAQLYELDLVEVVVDAGVSAKTLDRARDCGERSKCSRRGRQRPCWS